MREKQFLKTFKLLGATTKRLEAAEEENSHSVRESKSEDNKTISNEISVILTVGTIQEKVGAYGFDDSS